MPWPWGEDWNWTEPEKAEAYTTGWASEEPDEIPVMVWTEGVPDEVRQRADEALSALDASTKCLEEDPDDPVAKAFRLCAAEEAERALALWKEFDLRRHT